MNWNVTLGDEACPTGKAVGTWGFWVQEDESSGTFVVSSEANSGDTIGLAFAGVPQGGCGISLSVVDGGDALCATDDPDAVCGLDVRFIRAEAVGR
ncbi:hypothetical protein [Streptomyces sp. NPDC002133]|uniref:hypothetical protein n=1 Tax=Streptomyces sp. NPDC002133 TaxID=3154409 RepID=UPI0033249AF6